jgi:hypothetical protein
MKKALLSLSVIAVVFSFSACNKKDTTPPNTASVMFVNGCAGASNVDVSVNGTKLNSASNLAFLKNSGYQSITAGSNTLAYTLTATGTPLVNTTQTLTASVHYSFFTGGLVTGTSTTFVFTTDDVTAPSSGKAKVRFINLSSDNLNTSCYIGSVKIDSNVGYKTCTPFFEIMPTTAKVSIIDQAVLSNSGEILGQSIVAGKIYTFMLTGTSGGNGSSALTLTAINNN